MSLGPQGWNCILSLDYCETLLNVKVRRTPRTCAHMHTHTHILALCAAGWDKRMCSGDNRNVCIWRSRQSKKTHRTFACYSSRSKKLIALDPKPCLSPLHLSSSSLTLRPSNFIKKISFWSFDLCIPGRGTDKHGAIINTCVEETGRQSESGRVTEKDGLGREGRSPDDKKPVTSQNW